MPDTTFPDPAPADFPCPTGAVPSPRALKVILLYRSGSKDEERLLRRLEERLVRDGHTVFVDRRRTRGESWACEVEERILAADVVIPFLSASSLDSEVMEHQIRLAREADRSHFGQPRILPLRIRWTGCLPDPFRALLPASTGPAWESEADDGAAVEAIADQVRLALESPEAEMPRKLEMVGGAVPLDSEFYIVRETDQTFHDAIERRDSIVLVKGARQMGKTSLLARGLQHARDAGHRVILSDLQSLSAAHLKNADAFFLALAESIADQLDLDVWPDEAWNDKRQPGDRFERYLRREVIGKNEAPLVWGLDEVDRLFTCPFGGEAFGRFRSWHNKRSLDPDGPWRRLTLAISYSTESRLFIGDVNQSPFNVGTRVSLEDFTPEEVGELNRRHGYPLRNASELDRFVALVGGHPYLVRRGLLEMAQQGVSIARIEEESDGEEGIFGEHLRRLLLLLVKNPNMCGVVKGVLRGEGVPTPERFHRLRSAGVLAGDSERTVHLRCRLYERFLERNLL